LINYYLAQTFNGRDKMNTENKRYELEDEVENTKDEILGVLDDIASIKSQLKMAHLDRDNWEKHDYQWEVKAKYNLRNKGCLHQRLNLRLAKANKKLKAIRIADSSEREGAEERVFIRLVKEMLGKEAYMDIWREVHESIQSQMEGIK